MLLNFGPIKIDTKGMPPVFSVNVYKPLGESRLVAVNLTLNSHTRASVERWAKRLGAQITEEDVEPLTSSDVNTRRIKAVLESGGYRVTVHTTIDPTRAGGAS